MSKMGQLYFEMQEMLEYQEGYDAFSKPNPICPYKYGKKRDAWQLGYNYATSEYAPEPDYTP